MAFEDLFCSRGLSPSLKHAPYTTPLCNCLDNIAIKNQMQVTTSILEYIFILVLVNFMLIIAFCGR